MGQMWHNYVGGGQLGVTLCDRKGGRGKSAEESVT